MKELIKIQRFSLNDGPGIRTTLFFKGCNLKCPYCCNPENLINDFGRQEDVKLESMGLQGERLQNERLQDGNKLFGEFYSTEEVSKVILKDISYYDIDGGVTFSGGEPYIHADFILKLCKILKEKNINTAINTTIETSLVCDESDIIKLIDYIDMYIIDIKTLDFDTYRDYYNGDLNIFLNNIKLLKNKLLNDKFANAIFRITFVDGINNNKKDIDLIIDFIKKYKVKNIEICSVHNLAANKYKELGIQYKPFKIIKDEELNIIKAKLSEYCEKVSINKI